MTSSSSPAAARGTGTVPTEPVLAVIGLAAVLVGQLLVGAGRLWLLLDLVGGLLAIGAARAIGRRRWADAGTGPVLLLDAAGLAAIAGALALVALRGPEARVAALPMLVLSVAGTLLALLVLGTGVLTVLRGRRAAAAEPVGPEGVVPARGLVVLCGSAAVVAALVVVKDALLR